MGAEENMAGALTRSLSRPSEGDGQGWVKPDVCVELWMPLQDVPGVLAALPCTAQLCFVSKRRHKCKGPS